MTKPFASMASTSRTLRLPPFTDVRECFAPENLQDLAINPNLPVIAIRTPKVGELSRKERDDIKPMFHAKGGAKVFEDFKRIGNKFPDAAAAIAKKTGMEDGDLIVLVAGSTQSGSARSGPQTPVSEHRKVTPQELAIYASAGLLRLALAQKYADRHGIFKKTSDAARDFRFLWVTNFPMFEWDEGDKSWNAAHHPFTSPHEEDMSKLESGVEALHDPLSPLSAVRALAYDVVLEWHRAGLGLDSYSPPGCAEQNLPRAGHDRRRSSCALRIFSRSARIWHASRTEALHWASTASS